MARSANDNMQSGPGRLSNTTFWRISRRYHGKSCPYTTTCRSVPQQAIRGKKLLKIPWFTWQVNVFQIRSTSAHDFLKGTEELLKLLIQVFLIHWGCSFFDVLTLQPQRVCLTLPDALVSPKLWNSYSLLLDEIIFDGSVHLPHHRYMEQNITDLRYLLCENLSDARQKNRALLFCGPIVQASDRLGTAVSDVKVRIRQNSALIERVCWFFI